MDNGQISKVSTGKKYSVWLDYVEKQELGNILRQFSGEQKNTKKYRVLSSSAVNGAPLRNCNITVNIAYNTPRQWSDPVRQSS